MSHNSMIYLLVAFLVLLCATTEAKKECSIDCQEDGSAAVDLGLVLPPELYESTRLSNLLARPSSQFKMKRDYDFVRFGRAAPIKKASYDYIRFGRK
ncbi:FMRF-Like Peptide [Caenorhabditis elegans]|uniref:FMRF-Like Peptide n=1 Tax=Caenorhabditis elegans TaxID=6239 RepID=Q6LAC9_CAEEL|nr:FMRF-Like Peptide [Caenorhabditis elegans]CAE54900.1 FMRF-Like Peptide [Caenorhabditis elegans]|eukprot:NP_001022665.1 FMRF-Like Peptide [Caenorhabditis elegans]